MKFWSIRFNCLRIADCRYLTWTEKCLSVCHTSKFLECNASHLCLWAKYFLKPVTVSHMVCSQLQIVNYCVWLMYVQAINNMAVCSLYLGRLKEALQLLENLVYSDPVRHLQEGILLNLCTLYELESSRALIKKQSLLSLVSQYKGNGFNVACLKLSWRIMIGYHCNDRPRDLATCFIVHTVYYQRCQVICIADGFHLCKLWNLGWIFAEFVYIYS